MQLEPSAKFTHHDNHNSYRNRSHNCDVNSVMSINTKTSTIKILPRSKGLEFGNRTFHLGCGINLSHCGIEIVEYCEELWLRPLSQD